VARIEQGAASRLTVGTLERVAAAVGARVVCRLSWNGEALDPLLDESHADVVERTVRLLQASGWVVATEVSFNIYGDRGAVDILAFHSAAAVLLVVEVKSVVPDLQATLATLDRKVTLGRPIASARGWTPRRGRAARHPRRPNLASPCRCTRGDAPGGLSGSRPGRSVVARRPEPKRANARPAIRDKRPSGGHRAARSASFDRAASFKHGREVANDCSGEHLSRVRGLATV
jgi:hypothetical protein